MKIKRLPIVFHDVLTMKVQCPEEEWFDYAISIRDNIVLNDLYATGPISFQMEQIEGTDEVAYTFYQPINEAVEMEENSGHFFFQSTLQYKDGLLIRCVDFEDVEDMYQILDQAAKEYGVTLQLPYLHIYLNVYGEGYFDIYAPIKELAHD